MDRDYRVTYRTREVDRDDDGYDTGVRRVPSALDPYRYPNDRDELKRNVAEAKARNKRYHDDDYRARYAEYDRGELPRDRERERDVYAAATTSVRGSEGVRETATVRPGTTKTTYSVTQAGLEKESEVVVRGGTGRRGTRDYDDREQEIDVRRTSTRADERLYDDRRSLRKDDRYERERPRREGRGYVVDVDDADVIDVYTGSGNRGYAGYRNDPYEVEFRRGQDRDPPMRESRFREIEPVYAARDARSSAASPQGVGPYMSGARSERTPTAVAARSQPDVRDVRPRATTRTYEDESTSRVATYGQSRTARRRDEEDWGIVEKTSTRESGPAVREDFRDSFRDGTPPDTSRGRARASTLGADNDYVMVTPPRDSATVSTAGASTLHSAMYRRDSYTPDERQRRRMSRSISFHETEAAGHDRGDRFVERPGAEAAMMGKYLKHYGSDDEEADYSYSSRNRREDREPQRYAPQRVRSRSRRRRDDDDESYISTKLERTVKDTYY